MIISKKDINGYILAGGKSSRMGEDKGLMLFNGKAVIQYVIDALRSEVNEVVIVSNNPAYQQFGLEVIADEIRDIGPAGGIYTALNHSTLGLNFIVSCDMPFVNSIAIKYLIENSEGSQIVLPEKDGQMEPLFGIYKLECLTEWQRLIQGGVIKLHEMVSYFDLRKISVDGNSVYSDLTFTNINTREEFENASKQ